MLSRIVTGGLAGAAVGAAMLALSATSASAFTLDAPSPAPAVAAANIDHVWWDAWGRWHPNNPWRWHRHYRQCWRGPWGRVHCRYW